MGPSVLEAVRMGVGTSREMRQASAVQECTILGKLEVGQHHTHPGQSHESRGKPTHSAKALASSERPGSNGPGTAPW